MHLVSVILAVEIIAARSPVELSKPEATSEALQRATPVTISLMAQPMAVPRPKVTMTQSVTVSAVHDGQRLAMRLTWADKERNAAGRLAEFSDAVAIQFPVNDPKAPPPVFMGAKDNPVHIFHWRAQYQEDMERGLRSIKDHYPNMNVDVYPFEFPNVSPDAGADQQREIYSYGRAAGNPQSYAKKGVDELMAEGYGTSSVVENIESDARGEWADGKWTVTIKRPLSRDGGSSITNELGTFVAFAVWQGGEGEVGSRKSVTMTWTPLKLGQ